jgi:tetratricopeptide (TPR) repeat protein
MRQWILVGVVLLGAAVLVGVLVLPEAGAPAEALPEPVDLRLERIEQQTQAALENRRDIRPMIADLRALLVDHPEAAAAHRLLGMLLSQRGEAAQAYEHIQKAVSLTPEPRAEVLAILGSLAMALERPEDARAHFEDALERDPANSRIRLQLAHTLMLLGASEAAREQLDRVIRIDATQHKAYAMLATLAADAGDLSRAIELTGGALKRVPSRDVPTRVAYSRQQARYWTQQGQPGEALATLRLLPIEAQFDMDLANQMADLWAQLGEPEKAADHYEKAATLFPALPDAPHRAAQWYEKAQMPDAARRMRELARRRGQ